MQRRFKLAAAMVPIALAMALPAAASTHLTEAEVRKVDREAGKVTLKHGAIANLQMPPMTMVFRLKEPAMVDQLKVGDRIRFKAEKVEGAYTVVEVVPARD